MSCRGVLGRGVGGGSGPVSSSALCALRSALCALPRALPQAQVSDLISHAADSRLNPCRDRAIVVLFSRLGLRSREVAGLRLDDLNWRAGTVLVHGKGRVVEPMPLPADAGAAIAGYLEHERPAIPDRHLFLQARAPMPRWAVPVSAPSSTGWDSVQVWFPRSRLTDCATVPRPVSWPPAAR